MKELFQWVPWFRELAKAIREGRQAGLVDRAKKVDWAGGRCAVLDQGEDKADPLTFFYHLASIAGGRAEKRETVYSSVADVFGIESAFDYSRTDGFIFPIPPGLQVLFNNTGANPGLLWKMFHQAHALDGTSYGTVSANTFAEVLQIRGVAVPKLTQVLFLINPRSFLPFDKAAVLPLGIGRLTGPPAKLSWDEYVDETRRIRTAFPGCHPYEINVIGYLWTDEYLPRKGKRWYQIGTSEDGWRDFRHNHWVHLGGQEDKQDQRLGEPKPGDVILVRTGKQEGRGIGIVYRNDYSERSHPNDRIHVLWVNKEQAALAADMPTVGFSGAGRAEYEAFAESDAYSATLDLLLPPPPGQDENINTLYAQFYQPLVARLRENGMQPVGKGGWRGRWRSFQTGYQGAVYATELDGGKAKVFLHFSGSGNRQRFRALLQHREEIERTVKGTVLWLEETQGDWDTTVLQEKDAAFSLTGPKEDLEPTRLWMADTLLALRSAVQPHLDQVMQVKDTSPQPPSPASLIRSLTDRGLLFPQELVVNYILALQTKRFAILTGISGTGKTKIAMAVAERFQPLLKTVAKIPDDAIDLEVKPSYIKHGSIVLPVTISVRLNIKTGMGPSVGPDIRVRYPKGHIDLRTYLAGGKHPQLLFKGEFKEWFHSTFDVGDNFWVRVHASETDDPGEIEIGLPRHSEIVDEPLDNHTVIPVRPDWVDNRGLLGYLNPLTNEYSTTEFLDLLLRARDEEKRAKDAGEKPHPFFVILDEMNLARVEHYFSDFLSALESGKAISLHENKAIETGESKAGPQVPRKLKVPGNVLFTGTVNVDETTYMFSPKVLDRAFTIEFDQVDLEGFTDGASSEDASGVSLDGVQGSLDLLPAGRSKDDDWKPSREDWVEFSQETGEHHEALLRLHNMLEAQHMHFGYRVANEIARFVNLAREQAKDTDTTVDAAFDLALLQKVLPKFHGTQQELQSLLEQIFHFAVHGGGYVPKKDQTVQLDDWRVVKGRLAGRPKTKARSQAPSQTPSDAAEGDANEADSDAAKGADAVTMSPAYPRTGAKVLRMLNRLRDRGFTSFIE